MEEHKMPPSLQQEMELVMDSAKDEKIKELEHEVRS